MKPRDFLNFFKTKSGKLVLFVALFGGGLLLFSALHGKSSSNDDMDVRVSRSQTNMTDKPQVVQTVVRPMQPFYPPTPKPDQLPTSQTNAALKVLIEHRPQETALAPLPSISLFGDSTAGVAEPKSVSSTYAPFGRLIP